MNGSEVTDTRTNNDFREETVCFGTMDNQRYVPKAKTISHFSGECARFPHKIKMMFLILFSYFMHHSTSRQCAERAAFLPSARGRDQIWHDL
jgi:hypothetical protein